MPRKPEEAWQYAFHPPLARVRAGGWQVALSVAVAVFITSQASGYLKVPAVLAGIVLVAATCWRACQLGVWANERHVRIRNFWRSWDVPWAEIDEVWVSLWAQLPRWAFALQDGDRIYATVVPWLHAKRETQRLLAADPSRGTNETQRAS